MRDIEPGPGEVEPSPIQRSMKSNLNDQTEVQLSAAIRRMKDSVDHYQGGH